MIFDGLDSQQFQKNADFDCFSTFLINLAKDLEILNNQNIPKMKKLEELKALIASLEPDFDKFYNKGNSAAGTRVRKGMQDVKNAAQAIRAEVQDLKNKETK